MVLSIGMIVINAEKELEKCLSSIQPILDELDSELIVVDTGSTDRTVEIAKRFTDKVFFYKWTNDFSAARNVTLEHATGEWYMWLDQDEFAVDCAPLINFFKSGEYKKFLSASLVQRSFSDTDDTEGNMITIIERLVKRFPETKYKYTMHEILTPTLPPEKLLDFVIMHTGYMYGGEDGKERLRKKALARLNPELDELNNSDGEPRILIYFYISRSYRLIDDLENSLEYIDMGFEKLDHHDILAVKFYELKLNILWDLERYADIIAVSDEYFDADANPFRTQELITDALIRRIRAGTFYHLENYRSAIREFINIFDLCRRFYSGKLNTPDFSHTSWVITKNAIRVFHDAFFRCCIKENEFELADKYTSSYPIEDILNDEEELKKHLDIRIEIMKNVGYNKLNDLYRQLNDFGRNYLLAAVRQNAFTSEPDKRTVMLKKMSALGDTAKEVADIYKGYFNNTPDLERVRAFIQAHGSENSEDMLFILLENQADISSFLLAPDFFADRAAQIIVLCFPNDFAMFENYNVDVIAPQALDDAASLYGFVMLHALESERPISRLFEIYGALGLRWFIAFGDGQQMPGNIRAALLVNAVTSAKSSGDKNKFDLAVGELKKIVPDLIPLVDAYANENKNAFQAAANSEFAQLAVRVKQNIRSLISIGDAANAQALLEQYESLAPNDPDIDSLRRQING